MPKLQTISFLFKWCLTFKFAWGGTTEVFIKLINLLHHVKWGRGHKKLIKEKQKKPSSWKMWASAPHVVGLLLLACHCAVMSLPSLLSCPPLPLLSCPPFSHPVPLSPSLCPGYCGSDGRCRCWGHRCSSLLSPHHSSSPSSFVVRCCCCWLHCVVRTISIVSILLVGIPVVMLLLWAFVPLLSLSSSCPSCLIPIIPLLSCCHCPLVPIVIVLLLLVVPLLSFPHCRSLVVLLVVPLLLLLFLCPYPHHPPTLTGLLSSTHNHPVSRGSQRWVVGAGFGSLSS